VAWNEPGGNKGKDPWGKRRTEQGPPDLDQILKSLRDRLNGLFGGSGGGGESGSGGTKVNRLGLVLIVAVAVLLWLLSGFYIVQQSERGVILHFGKKAEPTGPGLHWRWPYPVERVEKVNVDQVSTLWIGRRSEKNSGGDNGYMLTEDENIIVVEFSVQYKVSDASDYLFNVRDPVSTITQATESAAREVVGKSKLDFVMTDGQLEVAERARVLLQEILDRYKTGIKIVKVQMQKASPPEEVKAAFEDVVKAREDEQRLKNEAEAYANDIIPRARGAAARMIQEAQGYKVSVTARAEGDARRFSLVVNEYVKAPGVTRDRLYIETMEQVLSSTTKILVDQKAGNNMIYLPLDRLISHQPTGTGPVTGLQPLPEPGDSSPAPLPRAREAVRDRGAR